MKRTHLLLTLCFTCAIITGFAQEPSPNTLTQAERAQGWELLWDGKTTNGWRASNSTEFPTKGWSIEDGLLVARSEKTEKGSFESDIITRKIFKDFEFSVDFKLTDGANSGIKYFIKTTAGVGDNIGCEYQILDDALHPDAKQGVGGNRTLGSLYDLIPAASTKPYRKDSFNTARIVVKGSHVTHYLNGIKIVEYDRGTQLWRALVAYSKYAKVQNFGEAVETCILLQDHGNTVWFKNIKIRTL